MPPSTKARIRKEFNKEFIQYHPGDSGMGGNYPQEPVYAWAAAPEDVLPWILSILIREIEAERGRIANDLLKFSAKIPKEVLSKVLDIINKKP